MSSSRFFQDDPTIPSSGTRSGEGVQSLLRFLRLKRRQPPAVEESADSIAAADEIARPDRIPRAKDHR